MCQVVFGTLYLVEQIIYHIWIPQWPWPTMADNGHGMQQIMKSPIHSISSMKKGDWSGRSASETKFCSYNPVWQLWSSETVSSESFGMPLNIERFASHSASCRLSSLDLGGGNPCWIWLPPKSDKLIHNGIPQWNRMGVYFALRQTLEKYC